MRTPVPYTYTLSHLIITGICTNHIVSTEFCLIQQTMTQWNSLTNKVQWDLFPDIQVIIKSEILIPLLYIWWIYFLHEDPQNKLRLYWTDSLPNIPPYGSMANKLKLVEHLYFQQPLICYYETWTMIPHMVIHNNLGRSNFISWSKNVDN